jgi:hypothetical protein
MQEVQIEMRKRVTVKVGDMLFFSPASGAIGGPDSRFFEKYEGMNAKVLGFDEDGMNQMLRMLSRVAESEEPEPEVVTGRFFVEFENGDKPKDSIHAVHFVVL